MYLYIYLNIVLCVGCLCWTWWCMHLLYAKIYIVHYYTYIYIYTLCILPASPHPPNHPPSRELKSSCQSMQWAAHLPHLAHGWLCRCAATGVSSGAQPSWRPTSATWCSSCTPVRCFLLSEFLQQYLPQKQSYSCFWIDHSTIMCHGLTCHGWCLSKLFLMAGLNTKKDQFPNCT